MEPDREELRELTERIAGRDEFGTPAEQIAGRDELRELTEQIAGRTKTEASAIVHEWMQMRGAVDEADITRAYGIKDLFDCRTCVNHVAQMVLKGIIPPDETTRDGAVFGMRRKLTYEEARDIAERAANAVAEQPEAGIRSTAENTKTGGVTVISVNEMRQLMAEGALAVDVRTADAYEDGHPDGAVWCPVSEYLRNPYGVSDNPERPIIFLCEQGVNSRIAAECAERAGFRKVYSVSLNGTA